MTSQLFANLYLDEFDHFVKETLHIKRYIRYTDDFVVIHHNPVELAALVPTLRDYLRQQLLLELHPKKIVLRKLRQGIDFLGYIQLPHHRVLRTKTKQRIMRRMRRPDDNAIFARMQSYLGVLSHGNMRQLAEQARKYYLEYLLNL